MEVGRLFVTMTLNRGEFNRGMQETRRDAEGFGAFMRNSFQYSVGNFIWDMAKKAIKGAWDMSIGFNASMEQNQIAFTTMLGSAQKAKDFLAQLAKMAADTPFEMEDLTSASKKLLAFGFEAEKIPKLMTAIGDAASGLGMSGKEGLDRLSLAFGL